MTRIDAIEIPKGATNGDIIKAIFPNGKYIGNANCIQVFADVNAFSLDSNAALVFSQEWLNTPYKREVEE